MKTAIFLITLLLLAVQSAVADEELDRILIQSAYDGELASVEALVKKGASIDAVGPKSRTALFWAAANGHTEVVAFLHDSGADIDAKDKDYQTALMIAVKESHPETVKYLLENGASVNQQTKKKGMTALMIAAAVGDVDVVRMLLDSGADKQLAEIDGTTALDRARQFGHPEITALLEQPSDPAGSS